jgi:hypothetical protein
MLRPATHYQVDLGGTAENFGLSGLPNNEWLALEISYLKTKTIMSDGDSPEGSGQWETQTVLLLTVY